MGPSTGAIVRAAIDFGLEEDDVAVAVSPDNIFKYGSYFAEVVKEEAAVSL